MSRPIILDDVLCFGMEGNILNCSYDSVSNCDHLEDAGVICGAVCQRGNVRLAIADINVVYEGFEDFDDDYFIKDELARGRLEICMGGRYGTVCDKNWDNNDASVACSQLGFSPYGNNDKICREYFPMYGILCRSHSHHWRPVQQ